MVNDKVIRSLFIPLLGIVIPVISGFYHYEKASFTEILIANSYSIFISFCIWQGGSWIIYKCRLLLPHHTILKVCLLCLFTVLYASVIATLLSGLWLFFTAGHRIDWQVLMKNTTAICIAVVVFTLIYEILFLTNEKESEHQESARLNSALTKAQLTALKNELDPHFIYNALNTLSWLIKKDQQKADLFIDKLSEVYRYFLINRQRKYVTLAEELEFIEKYFFLLQVRYENKIQLTTDVNNHDVNNITILPCALQLLVENAIKHNAFSEADPLSIRVTINEHNIFVINTKRQGKIPFYSTRLGLSNLKERYQLAGAQPVTVESGKDYFMVRLPMLKSA